MASYEEKILQADRLLQELISLSPMNKSDEARLWEKFRLEWNWNSNHLEGNTLTYGETQLLLIHGKAFGDHDKREYAEMEAHDAAVELVRQWASDQSREITESDIRNLHKIILVRPFWKDAITPDGKSSRRLIKVGEYKEFPNHVQLATGEIFRYAEPVEVPALMDELLNWYRAEEKNLHPLEVSSILHYRFVRIHPFDDGNGRLARLIGNYHLLKSGYPPVIFLSKEKKGYLDALNKADVGDLQAFIAFCADRSVQSLEIAIKAAKGESLDEAEDWKKQVELLKRKAKDHSDVEKKSEDLVFKRIKDSIIPLFEQLAKDLSIFDELFALNDVKSELVGASIPLSIWELREVDFLMNPGPLQTLQKAILSFKWEGYKYDNNNTFSVFAELEVMFSDPFKYELLISGQGESLRKLYSQPLSETEVHLISNNLGAYVLNRIKESSGRPK